MSIAMFCRSPATFMHTLHDYHISSLSPPPSPSKSTSSFSFTNETMHNMAIMLSYCECLRNTIPHVFAPLQYVCKYALFFITPEASDLDKAVSASLEVLSYEESLAASPEFKYLSDLLAVKHPDFAIRHVPGTGGCFFTSILTCLSELSESDRGKVWKEGWKANETELRWRTMDYMRSNSDRFRHFAPYVMRDNRMETWDEYLLRMRSANVFVSHCEVQACAAMLGLQITIHSLDYTHTKYKQYTHEYKDNESAVISNEVTLFQTVITDSGVGTVNIHIVHHFPISWTRAHYTPLISKVIKKQDVSITHMYHTCIHYKIHNKDTHTSTHI